MSWTVWTAVVRTKPDEADNLAPRSTGLPLPKVQASDSFQNLWHWRVVVSHVVICEMICRFVWSKRVGSEKEESEQASDFICKNTCSAEIPSISNLFFHPCPGPDRNSNGVKLTKLVKCSRIFKPRLRRQNKFTYFRYKLSSKNSMLCIFLEGGGSW